MKQTVTEHMFINDIQAIRPENFSYEGLQVLFNYLDEIEPEDSDLEFDPIGLCCDFSQCSLKEFKDAFTDVAITSEMTDEEKRQTISEFIGMYGFWHAFVEDGKEIIFENF